MDEIFPRPIRLPGQPEPPREVPEERRHSPPKIVDEPIDAYGAGAAAAALAERLEQVRSGAVRVTDDGIDLLAPPFTPGRDRVDGPQWARSTLVVFGAHGTPSSRLVGRVLAAIRTRDPVTVAIAWRHFPDPAAHPYPRLFEPDHIAGRPNPRHLELRDYLARAREAARHTAHANGAERIAVGFPDGATIAPVRVRVIVSDPVRVDVGGRHEVPVRAVAEAELVPPSAPPGANAGSGYHGPLAHRQSKPMRPDVALAFDRLAAAAHRDGIDLIVVSGYRTDAEQAALFAAHPDPKWVAPPGHSLHRLGTELDLGPVSAYAWLAHNAERFHFCSATRGNRATTASQLLVGSREPPLIESDACPGPRGAVRTSVGETLNNGGSRELGHSVFPPVPDGRAVRQRCSQAHGGWRPPG